MESHDPSYTSVDRQQVDRVLRLKREQRGATACYPCRQRKVKCDSNQPCKTCKRRNHPEICIYTAPEQTASVRRSPARRPPVSSNEDINSPYSSPRSRGHQGHVSTPSPSSAINRAFGSRQSIATSLDPDSGTRDEYPFSGDNSLPSIIRNSTQDGTETLTRDIEPALGLQNTYTIYPFMDEGLQHNPSTSLTKVLPQREEILKYFHFYRTFANPFSPTVVDIEEVETSIYTYLDTQVAKKTQSTGSDGINDTNSDLSIGQICVILATLASGAHFSDDELAERTKKSQDFARRSFQALRLANFLFRPSLEVVQTLLILGHVLQNQGQSDATWAMLGLTVRLAQTLGLHTDRGANKYPEHVRLKRRKLWSIIIWHDCLLCLCHDRQPAVLKPRNIHAQSSNEPLSYVGAMQKLCLLSLDVLNRDEDRYIDAFNSLVEVDNLQRQLQPHLQNITSSKNMQQRLEHLAFRIHASFMTSFICRPAIKHPSQVTDSDQDRLLRNRAKSSLIEASKAFLDFQRLSIVPMRTWSMIHAVLTSTVLLGIWEDTRNDTECRDLQRQVMDVFLALDNPSLASDDGAAEEGAGWLSGPHIRALMTLKNSLHGREPQFPVNTELQQPVEETIPQANQSGMWDVNMGAGTANINTSQLADASTNGFDYFNMPLNQADLSPWTYLDSIMNVPMFDNSQQFGPF
ncbi:uncharacterized protein BHQ10_004181 [Talaromyces amestolkiae]|uniref:Zn(2)-C6 fungal-type domain-containing protein n=1 Tax=Talaromyces amestolkiae TaxID=1196081 RepID=A0A364KXB2_TALAM|nr:uncharacterized protein BHQ10_004181 [Talaromyces amestolkiae]RAO68169.1 hypothetical protein BHQ10_004181 [Talaromyces amestolkiae]